MVEISPDPIRPNLSILLTCSKEGTDLSLSWAFFDQTRMTFFDPKEKFGIFSGNFQNPGVADPTRPSLKVFDPDPSELWHNFHSE